MRAKEKIRITYLIEGSSPPQKIRKDDRPCKLQLASRTGLIEELKWILHDNRMRFQHGYIVSCFKGNEIKCDNKKVRDEPLLLIN
ncbi:hypothetical protein BSA145_01265 [Bacillus safensis]|uniref:Uncharacterized protein n=1 Tax=Bacillus safensis TaxID=561879 RepID=A0A1L6ZDU7_BACIA|nr:hypothetical protein BSA145_01265 [Bacillus safensis]